MKNRPLASVLIALIIGSLPLLAQAKPNFTGKWIMNIDKSSYGAMPTPESLTWVIEHNDPKIKIVTTQVRTMGESSTERTCTIDGSQCTEKIRMGEVKSSTAKWDGETLLMESSADISGMDRKSVEKVTLSTDGKTLTVTTASTTVMGTMEFESVLDKK